METIEDEEVEGGDQANQRHARHVRQQVPQVHAEAQTTDVEVLPCDEYDSLVQELEDLREHLADRSAATEARLHAEAQTTPADVEVVPRERYDRMVQALADLQEELAHRDSLQPPVHAAAQTTPTDIEVVPRQEYDSMVQALADLRQQQQQQQQFVAAQTPSEQEREPPVHAAAQTTPTDVEVVPREEYDRMVQALADLQEQLLLAQQAAATPVMDNEERDMVPREQYESMAQELANLREQLADQTAAQAELELAEYGNSADGDAVVEKNSGGGRGEVGHDNQHDTTTQSSVPAAEAANSLVAKDATIAQRDASLKEQADVMVQLRAALDLAKRSTADKDVAINGHKEQVVQLQRTVAARKAELATSTAKLQALEASEAAAREGLRKAEVEINELRTTLAACSASLPAARADDKGVRSESSGDVVRRPRDSEAAQLQSLLEASEAAAREGLRNAEVEVQALRTSLAAARADDDEVRHDSAVVARVGCVTPRTPAWRLVGRATALSSLEGCWRHGVCVCLFLASARVDATSFLRSCGLSLGSLCVNTN